MASQAINTAPGFQLKDLAPLATGVIAAFTAALGALTAVAGIGAQIARNQPKLGVTAFLLLVAALSVAVGGLIAQRGDLIDDRIATILVPISAILFIVGVVSAVLAAVQAATAPTQPSLSATFTSSNGIFAVEGEAKTTGLPADQHVKIRAYTTALNGSLGTPIFMADEGPDSLGNVDAKFSIPLPHNGMPLIQIEAWAGDTTPDCNADLHNRKFELGCLLVPVPPQDTRPHLVVGVEGDPKNRVLNAKVKQSGVDDAQWLILQLMGTSASSTTPTVVYQAVLRPDGSGTVDDSLLIPIPQAVTDLCVAARTTTVPRNLTCPASDDDRDTSWTRLTLA
jgi:hypothetical protein